MAKTKAKKKLNNRSIIAIVICLGILLYLSVSIVKKGIDINNYEKELADRQSTLESREAENEELEELVTQSDEAKLAEDIARQKGYVMPDEHVFVDVTPGV